MEEIFFFATGLVLIVIGVLLYLTCFMLSHLKSKRRKMDTLILEQRDMPAHHTMDQEDGPPPEYDTIVRSYTIYQDPPPYTAE